CGVHVLLTRYLLCCTSYTRHSIPLCTSILRPADSISFLGLVSVEVCGFEHSDLLPLSFGRVPRQPNNGRCPKHPDVVILGRLLLSIVFLHFLPRASCDKDMNLLGCFGW
ncbi:hypothetical protein M758_UG292200, partial [Ceratodon purpureus]